MTNGTLIKLKSWHSWRGSREVARAMASLKAPLWSVKPNSLFLRRVVGREHEIDSLSELAASPALSRWSF